MWHPSPRTCPCMRGGKLKPGHPTFETAPRSVPHNAHHHLGDAGALTVAPWPPAAYSGQLLLRMTSTKSSRTKESS